MKSKKLNIKYNLRATEKLQHFVGVFLLLIIVLTFSSCSSNKYSQLEFNKFLSKNRVKAKTSPISFLVPKGWHVVDANNKAFIDLWFLRNDLNVSLSLLPFHSNSTQNGLENIFESSIQFQKTKYGNKINIIKEKPLRLNGRLTMPYNFSVSGSNYRVILFERNNSFYELTLFGVNQNIKIEYFIQELLISSAK